MAIEKLLDVSTAHMRNADREILEELYPTSESRPDRALRVLPFAEGWMISLSGFDPKTAGDREEKLAELRSEGFSEEFINVLVFGADAHCFFVNFDCDAEKMAEFPVFNWEAGDVVTPALAP